MNDVITESNNLDTGHSYLLFGLGEKVYGMDVDNVLEVIKLQTLDVPQRLPKNILGVIKYNGLAINVVDLRMILSLPVVPYNIDSQIIIVKTPESIFGVVADSVMEVFVFESVNMSTLPYHSEDNLIKFFYKYEDDYASIVDLDSVETVLQKTQFEQSETDVTSLLPKDETSVHTLKQRQIQLAEKKLPDYNEVFWSNGQYIIFALGESLYALDIISVREIVNFSSIAIVKLPREYDYLEGIFNLKGSFISILNLKKFLSLDCCNVCIEDEKLIVLDLKDFKLAFRVDDVINIATISNREITGKTMSKMDSKYSLAEIYMDGKIITILNLEKVLSDEKLYIQN